VGRSDCEKKWNKLSITDKKLIIEHVPKYVESTPDIKFRKNPETYINGKHWFDEIQLTQNKEAVVYATINRFKEQATSGHSN